MVIDTGSTHSFIDEKVARSLGCKASPITQQSISVVNGIRVQTNLVCKNLLWLLQGTIFCSTFLLFPLGNANIVLRVQWLNTLGNILFDFQNRTVGFVYQGSKHVPRGVDN